MILGIVCTDRMFCLYQAVKIKCLISETDISFISVKKRADLFPSLVIVSIFTHWLNLDQTRPDQTTTVSPSTQTPTPRVPAPSCWGSCCYRYCPMLL